MPQPEVELPEIAAEAAPAPGMRRWVMILTIALALLGLIALWLERENLAHRIIGRQLGQYGLPASYRLEKVGPREQVLTNVVVGDPARPDFTAERMEIQLRPRFGLPTIGSVRLVRPRLYGAYQAGRLTFGSLDRVLFAPGAKRMGLPDFDLRLEDGRARIETDVGPVGLKAEGRGNLRNAFAGQLAAIAPELRMQDCRLSGASAFGTISTDAGVPRFIGPVRLGGAKCHGFAIGSMTLQAELAASSDLSGFSAQSQFTGGPINWNGARAGGLGGDLGLSLRAGAMTANYTLALVDVGGQLAARKLTLAGALRSREGLAGFEGEGRMGGEGLQPGPALDQTLTELARSSAGTLGAPLLAQLRSALRREGRGSELSAEFSLRRRGQLTSLIVPALELTGTSGQDLLVLSRGQVVFGGQGGLRLIGNLRTGGEGLPRLAGQIERRPGGTIEARLTMAQYRAGDAAIALPRLVVVWRADGAVGLGGRALISGALPDGRVERLVLPIDGNWNPRRGLALWRGCTLLRFDSLRYASLTLDGRALTLCPGAGGAIVVSGPNGTRLAAGVPRLALSGRIGETPILLRSAAVGFAWPGGLAARDVDVTLGPVSAGSHFTIASLTGQLGKVPSGRFSGAEALLAAVPLDLREASGSWRYAGGRLSLGEGVFRLEDRLVDDRFRPVVARGATLNLANNRITALAALREPASDRIVTEATIVHDLASGTGHADLAVRNLVFDQKLQPDTLSYLALGVIANARGMVRGAGRIDWSPRTVTSTGSFTTDKLDFAAAFGPVQGMRGTVRFTDLLGMVTAPDQVLEIAAINPGIEVYEGVLRFQLEPDRMLVVKGAEWPFLGGRLQLLPTQMRLGASDERRFTLRLTAADAAKFVQQIEMSNVAARGVFDGDLPLVFDEQGGRIEGGLLVSRPPGGSVAYVGALTYKDMGAMANFAFQSLRSLDYRQMRIGMDGELDGEIFTRVRIDGVTQGAGARQNYFTRQIGKLPIRFNINVRAPFQRLLYSFRSLYDPAYVRDPRELGLVDKDGKPIDQPAAQTPLPPDIQPPVSRKVP